MTILKNIDKMIINKKCKIMNKHLLIYRCKFCFCLVIILIVCNSDDLFAQQNFLSLNHQMNISINYSINCKKKSINTGFKPLLQSDINLYFNSDSVIYKQERTERFLQKNRTNWIWRKMFFEDFVYVKQKNFRLSINPLFYLEYGKQNDTSKIFTINTRGVEIKADIGKKVSFYSNFRENQAFFRPYITEWTNIRLVAPGQGSWKRFKTSGFDFSSSVAYISITPIKWANIQVGNDKNFIGEGYRSLLLSDNSFNYPFLKISLNYKNFKYVAMISQFEDFLKVYYDYHYKKHFSVNYLSYSLNNRIEIGLFEGAIFKSTNGIDYSNKIPFDFFVPIIGVHSLRYRFKDENKVLVGLNTKIKATNFVQFYGQLAVDDFKKSNYAYQIGTKVFDLLHNKLKNQKIYLQFEYNNSESNTYKSVEPFQAWSNYNQELAHPSGNNFTEIYADVNYSFRNFFIDFKYNNIKLNKNNLSSNIFSNFDNQIFYTSNVSHKTISCGWIVNPRTNLQFYSGIDIRTQNSITEKFLYFGIRTNISNYYYDY